MSRQKEALLEKRKHPRLEAQYLIRMCEPGGMSEPGFVVISENISMGGIKVWSEQPLWKGRRFNVEIFWSGTEIPPSLAAKTVRCGNDSLEPRSFWAVMRFLDPEEGPAAAKLRDFLRRSSKPEATRRV